MYDKIENRTIRVAHHRLGRTALSQTNKRYDYRLNGELFKKKLKKNQNNYKNKIKNIANDKRLKNYSITVILTNQNGDIRSDHNINFF